MTTTATVTSRTMYLLSYDVHGTDERHFIRRYSSFARAQAAAIRLADTLDVDAYVHVFEDRAGLCTSVFSIRT